ncbi:aldo/keto reductase family protein [Legionella sp. D16C41]|uniref:aldo/keto reductase family protein n=1 Tax=Legionella sp. D16C41 TaxID=3402688 RepID=UPI003AF8448D
MHEKKSKNALKLPSILYGTAWKEAQTESLVFQALKLGFNGIDTANQRKHYYEEGVGAGLAQFLKTGEKTRQDLFIQTKFTLAQGQDERKPYNEFDSLTKQVKQSFLSSLNHLQTDYIDSYILHGPSLSQGIIKDDLEIWQAMEELVKEGKVKFLGISNINNKQLETLYNTVSIKPSFVQNRCFANTQWDKENRLFCERNSIIYQGFSLLTANLSYLLTPVMYSIAKKYSKSIPQIIFRFAQQINILSLTGTTKAEHMRDDLNLNDFELTIEEIDYIECLGVNANS